MKNKIIVFIFLLLFFMACIPSVIYRLSPPTGDEPFYLMTALSLIKDGDLNEENNFANRDYWEFSPTCEQLSNNHYGDVGHIPIKNVPGWFGPGVRQCTDVSEGWRTELPPHFTNYAKQPGKYSKHGLGLSLMLIPAVYIGRHLGSMIFMVFLGVLVIYNMYLWAEQAVDQKIAFIMTGLLTLASPLYFYSYLIFPAIPSALMVIYAYRKIDFEMQKQNAKSNLWWQNLLLGCCIAFLPWLHSLYLVLSASLFICWILAKPRSAIPLIPITSSAILFLIFHYFMYSSMLHAGDHEGTFNIINSWYGILGLLFDMKWGLLIVSPIFLLPIAGMLLMIKVVPRQALNLAIIIIPYTIVIGSFSIWFGQWGPPARYLVPILPLSIVPFAEIFWSCMPNKFIKSYIIGCFCWSLIIFGFWIFNAHLIYPYENGLGHQIILFLEEKIPYIQQYDIARFFPYYVQNLNSLQHFNIGAAAAWGVISLLIIIIVLI